MTWAVNKALTQKKNRNSCFDSRLVLPQKQANKKREIDFNSPAPALIPLSSGTWYPWVTPSSSCPQTSHAKSLAVLLMTTDCKINLKDMWFFSLGWSHWPFIWTVPFLPLWKATDQYKHCSFLQSSFPCSRPPNIISGGLKVTQELLQAINDTEETRWNYKRLVLTKLGSGLKKLTDVVTLKQYFSSIYYGTEDLMLNPPHASLMPPLFVWWMRYDSLVRLNSYLMRINKLRL